jgi:dTDP-L-rhamnose 4-epimerase
VINVGGDKPYTVAEFASAVAQVFRVKDYHPISCGKFRFGDTRHIYSDVGKLTRLGWRPTRSVYDSVEAYRSWLATAENATQILDHCNLQMAKLNVVREVVKT